MVDKFYLGDIVQMKKQHPCGSYEWEVLRLGADIKIKCINGIIAAVANDIFSF